MNSGEVKFKYQSRMKLNFKSRDVCAWIYHSLAPDIKREYGEDLKLSIKIEDNSIYLDIYSNSLAKFLGVCSTLIRLLRLINNIDITVENQLNNKMTQSRREEKV